MESNVFDSDISYLCLVVDKRFDNCWQLKILKPYICRESEKITSFWLGRQEWKCLWEYRKFYITIG